MRRLARITMTGSIGLKDHEMTDYRSAEATAYRKLYKTARWQKLRLAHIRDSPICVYCARSHEISVADIVDHIRPHKGNTELFFDANNLQSLCKPHHDSEKQREESGQNIVKFGPDGWPL
jgi:5-methylcytosine-specific restriction endonuclease McrA